MYYHRMLESAVRKGLENNPVVAILGPRQCGKSTLAKHIAAQTNKEVTYLDLERPIDLQKLENADLFLKKQKNKLICLDEIQRKPDLFPLLRSLVDEWGGNYHFLILGSASRNLIKQSSESLAGRISFKQLTPFVMQELPEGLTQEDYLVRGGFPRSLLAPDDDVSFEWREDFITTFLERDLLLWSGFSTTTMRKLWQMLAHLNGQIINYANLGNALGVSQTTARNYVELLASTFMLKLLPPFLANTGKRLVKTPKVYLTDTGIANALLGVADFNQLTGHPTIGANWETLVLANLTATFPGYNFYFYRTGHGAEIDFILEKHGRIVCVECKSSLTPKLVKGTFTAIDDIHPEFTLVISPVDEGWQAKPGIEVVNLREAIQKIKEILD
jgi:predicted AAA+ superfamily ATPase